jgi:hypothetical protein
MRARDEIETQTGSETMNREQDAKVWRAGTGLLPIWEANHGCRCEIEDAALSMDKPPPRAAPAASSPPAVKVKPFDIQDIPATMRKLHMPMSAAMMERWFQGQLNYSPTEDDEREGLNQHGQPIRPA